MIASGDASESRKNLFEDSMILEKALLARSETIHPVRIKRVKALKGQYDHMTLINNDYLPILLILTPLYLSMLL